MLAHRRALTALIVVLALVAAGCGDDATPPEDVSGGPPAEWEEQAVPLERGPDTGLLTAVDGDTIVMLTVSDAGVVRSTTARGDAPFEPGPPLETGAEFLRLGGLARFHDAWWALGSGGTRPVPSRPDDWETTFDLHLVTSSDGLTWTEVEATGLEGPAEVSALVATDEGLVAVGHDQAGNLDGGSEEDGFGPRAWRSADGLTWAQVEVPGDADDFGPSALVATDDGLLALGSGDQAGVAWRSADDGASWETTELDGLGAGVRLTEVVPFGDALLASGSGPGDDVDVEGVPMFARSTDGGRSWAPVDGPPAVSFEGFGSPLFPAGDRAFTLITSSSNPDNDPTACYADIEQCRRGNTTALYAGDGGGTWERIDLTGLALAEHEELHGVLATDDRMVLWSSGPDEIVTWTTAVDATLPTEAEPVTATTDVPLLAEDEEPVVGVAYAEPFNTHCGIEWLYFADEPWQRTDDGPEPDNADGETIFGFATLLADGTVEYSTGDGEVIATYGPPTEEPPSCA